MLERDEEILKHVGRYGVTVRAVLEELFFPDTSCDNVLGRLIKEGRLISSGKIPGGLSCYQLSLSEARRRLVPDHRTRPKKGRALREALQVLVFCCLGEKRRPRIERRNVGKNFGNAKGSGKPHCAEVDGDSSIIYRIYAPGPNSTNSYLLKTLREDYAAAQNSPKLREWIEGGAFGFAVLIQSEKRKELILTQIERHGPTEIPILVEVVPGLSTFAEFLRKRKVKANGNE
jgi:hypothetical protein